MWFVVCVLFSVLTAPIPICSTDKGLLDKFNFFLIWYKTLNVTLFGNAIFHCRETYLIPLGFRFYLSCARSLLDTLSNDERATTILNRFPPPPHTHTHISCMKT